MILHWWQHLKYCLLTLGSSVHISSHQLDIRECSLIIDGGWQAGGSNNFGSHLGGIKYIWISFSIRYLLANKILAGHGISLNNSPLNSIFPSYIWIFCFLLDLPPPYNWWTFPNAKEIVCTVVLGLEQCYMARKCAGPPSSFWSWKALPYKYHYSHEWSDLVVYFISYWWDYHWIKAQIMFTHPLICYS